ncbi:2-oxoisovalerate dehydrogenase [Streptomyces sp. CB02009]|uniref:alpha-ketoacid dehydrogenase subunit beta n=1 Tax=Streptomyces sp. CB02009 TaxID=1703938 RepID=UPI00093DA430|nr:alpha-ketoacid dehydrogenase subunit beta [Streptomyces sp. CB02009]OKJ62370.1 2-oxoisovalerate dehydrogenase [Streptomyces sp. CB02009]
MVEAINTALREAMAEDERVVVFGQDVARQGGVFRVTEGLAERFGPQRCFDTPLAESAIVGVALGMAMRGLRPVPEIQFDGFTYPALDQIVSHLAKYRNRTRGALSVPVTLRVPSFGGIGAVEHHSESTETFWAHTAGLRVVTPATAADAHVLLRQSIDCDDPVIFLEPKRRYWQSGDETAEVPAAGLERALVRRSGTDVTVVAYGGTVGTALEAAETARREHGWELEVVDLRSLAPLDFPTIAASVSRTGRCVVLHEGPRTLGLGAEIAARVQEELFWDLEAPVLRVTGFDTPYPPARWEKAWLPGVDRLLDGIDRSFGYSHD